MNSIPRLVIIGLLVLSLGLWVGLGRQPTQTPDTDCDASLNWCSGADEQLQMHVTKSTKELSSNTGPDLIEIALVGVSATELSGRISGENMYMGQFNVNFKRNQQGQLQAITNLPNCVESQAMIWRLDINHGETASHQNQTFFFSSPTH
ncbi:MAG: hypothetical protein NZ738_10960 [Oceanospirillaceae bacterium]|nr:hypothetical protein [Oceanospirillaceae bacterium]